MRFPRAQSSPSTLSSEERMGDPSLGGGDNTSPFRRSSWRARKQVNISPTCAESKPSDTPVSWRYSITASLDVNVWPSSNAVFKADLIRLC
jgi:hypothetical protein